MSQRFIRPFLACLCLAVCLFCAWAAVRLGLSRMFSVYAAKTGSLEAAEKAARMTPSDPQAHFVKGALLKEYGRLEESVREYEEAAMLRPRDYVMWLDLGLARDEKEDQAGALSAFREAVRLAPDYSEPRWQLGNAELRAGLFDEAFAEMRRATQSRPALLPQLIDLAWSIYGRDVSAIERALGAQTPSANLALARFLVKHGKAADAARIFRTVEQVSFEDESALLKELLAAKQFRIAYEVWSAHAKRGESDAGSQLHNGGFEEKIDLKDLGFGWQVARDAATVQISIDNVQPHGGTSSLKLDWKGDSNPSAPIVSQLILVEPNTRYRLSFAARTNELVTGGPPLISVEDVADSSRELTHSASFERTTPWKDYTVEFTTGRESQAVLVAVRRQNCSNSPCPVFGSLWLDDFSLQKL
jgi:hypothetical protein